MNAREYLEYKLKTGHSLGLTCDLSSICTLECPACQRTRNRKEGLHPGQNGRELTPDLFDKIFDWYDSFNFCGQVSDPIFNNHLEYFLSKCYKHNKIVKINTAATSKSKGIDWYKKMFDANPKAQWTFGIDGLGDKSEWYRINQDYELIWDAMMLAATYPDMKVIWQYLIFSTNEDDVEEAIEIAKKNNITLRLDVTSGFGDADYLRPVNPRYQR